MKRDGSGICLESRVKEAVTTFLLFCVSVEKVEGGRNRTNSDTDVLFDL